MPEVIFPVLENIFLGWIILKIVKVIQTQFVVLEVSSVKLSSLETAEIKAGRGCISSCQKSQAMLSQ